MDKTGKRRDLQEIILAVVRARNTSVEENFELLKTSTAMLARSRPLIETNTNTASRKMRAGD